MREDLYLSRRVFLGLVLPFLLSTSGLGEWKSQRLLAAPGHLGPIIVGKPITDAVEALGRPDLIRNSLEDFAAKTYIWGEEESGGVMGIRVEVDGKGNVITIQAQKPARIYTEDGLYLGIPLSKAISASPRITANSYPSTQIDRMEFTFFGFQDQATLGELWIR